MPNPVCDDAGALMKARRQHRRRLDCDRFWQPVAARDALAPIGQSLAELGARATLLRK